jgi:hypothetical protein
VEQLRARRRFSPTHLLLGVALLGVLGAALLVSRPWTTLCPTDWSNALRIDLSRSSGDVVLEGRPFRVGGHALLDYMPRSISSPRDFVFEALRGERHPLTVTASISASSREALGDPAFTCFRVARGGEVWARRPTTYGTQTLADALPPGAPPPAYNEAWRLAVANDGPEWPDGDLISLELWANVDDRPYVFVLPPFALQRGG